LLVSATSYAESCGLSGSTHARIQDCQQKSGAFSLVTELESGERIWRDNFSKKIWTGKTYRSRSVVIASRICAKLEDKFPEYTWSVPKLRQLKGLRLRKASENLEGFTGSFWSTSINNVFGNYGYKFIDSEDGYVSVMSGDDEEEYEFAQNNYKCIATKR
nr:hypothetical protein [Bdellovibrionales bacterium]